MGLGRGERQGGGLRVSGWRGPGQPSREPRKTGGVGVLRLLLSIPGGLWLTQSWGPAGRREESVGEGFGVWIQGSPGLERGPVTMSCMVSQGGGTQ